MEICQRWLLLLSTGTPLLSYPQRTFPLASVALVILCLHMKTIVTLDQDLP